MNTRTACSAPDRARRLLTGLATAAVVLTSVACGDDPFALPWIESPDTVLLYSLARPEMNLTSGFNFQQKVAVRIEAATAAGSWDVAVDTRDGNIVFVPPTALGVTSQAAVATVPGETFATLKEAPSDTAAYVRDRAVPVREGEVYVVRTNQGRSFFGSRCFFYAKVEPLDVDPVGGTIIFRFDINPNCNDRRLIPPD